MTEDNKDGLLTKIDKIISNTYEFIVIIVLLIGLGIAGIYILPLLEMSTYAIVVAWCILVLILLPFSRIWLDEKRMTDPDHHLRKAATELYEKMKNPSKPKIIN